MVGEHLGIALIELLNIMREFRSDDVDNVADLQAYLIEEGYLNLRAQPTHSLAVLHLAEEFQLRDLYIDAFAHCCGMSDRLFLSPEYQLISSATRRLLRRARVDLDAKLGQMGAMLSTFLQDELSEAHLGLYPGARAHLERFRTMLNGYYAARFGFGYYPPPSPDGRGKIFAVDVFRTMREDFEALYHYLVDYTFDPSQSIQLPTQGGICALQSVQSFDTRQDFETLDHPLPKVPDVPQPAPSKKFSWFSKSLKVPSAQRAETLVALVKATNVKDMKVIQNGLVRVYRTFEEDSIYFPVKADKHENLNPADGRKVRWILIYALYQTLRNATEPPPEVRDPVGAPYHLSIATDNLPPWSMEDGTQSPSKPGQISRNSSFISTSGWCTPTEYMPKTPDTMSMSIEIKPDIDYLGLSQERQLQPQVQPQVQARPVSMMQRTFTKSVSRESTVRRSLRLFSSTRQTAEKPSSTTSSPVQPRVQSGHYHEIVVYGYGNGTNEVEFTSREQQPVELGVFNTASTSLSPNNNTKGATASRSASTSSDSSNNSASSSKASSTMSSGSISTAATSILHVAAESPAVCEDGFYKIEIDDYDDPFMRRRPMVSRPTTASSHTSDTRHTMHGLPRRSISARPPSLSNVPGVMSMSMSTSSLPPRPLTAHSSTSSLQQPTPTQTRHRHKRSLSTHAPKHRPLISVQHQQQYDEYESSARAAAAKDMTTTATPHAPSKLPSPQRSLSMPPIRKSASMSSSPLYPALRIPDVTAIPPVPPLPPHAEPQKRTHTHTRSKSSKSIRRLTIHGSSIGSNKDNGKDLLDLEWDFVAAGGVGFGLQNGNATSARPVSMAVPGTGSAAPAKFSAKEDNLPDWDLYNDLGGFKELKEIKQVIRAPKRASTIW